MASVQQGFVDVFERDPLHVRTEHAGPHELGVDRVGGDIVGHRAFGDQHNALGFAGEDIVVHRRRRTCEVGDFKHLGRAFRMSQHLGVRVGFLDLQDVGGGEALVDLAAALPGDNLDAGLARDVAGQEFIGDQDHPVDAPHSRGFLDHLYGVGAGAADVGLGLHLGGGVDVGHHRQARVALLDQPHVRPGDRGGQRAAGAQVRDQNGLLRRQDLGGLGHEVDARLDDHAGLGAGRFLGQAQAVADVVADPVENLRRHVVVGQDHRVLLGLQSIDRRYQRGLGAPFHRRDVAFDLFPDRGGLRLDLRGKRELEPIGGHARLLMLKLSISSA